MKTEKSKKKSTKKSSKQEPLPKSRKFTRSAINIIRTTQRNNIDLKHIADNKANILLSVNALMLTLLIPIFMSHSDFIAEYQLYLPIGLLGLTCFVTVILAAMVLLPFSQRGIVNRNTKFREVSPFLFENYDKMSVDEYFNYFSRTIEDEDLFFRCIVEDLHYFGRVNSLKYKQIKLAFLIFMFGICLSVITTTIVLLIT